MDPGLAAALGEEGYRSLRAHLRERAMAWTRAAAPGDTFEVTGAAALLEALADHRGPVLLVAPDVPALGPEHLAAARSDLADGVLVSVAPTNDSHLFLVALLRADPELLDAACTGFEALGTLVRDAGAALGLVRSERRLTTVADARALLADPLAPADVVALLEPVRLLGEVDSDR